jgi:serine/threonine-protein kinase RsbW
MPPAKLHFVIPSDFGPMRDVQAAIMEQVDARSFDDESLFAIKLALEEGLINAIKHGNKFDPSKTVTVDCKVTDRKFEIAITDQGEGFQRREVPDPLAEENLEKSSGRGLLLMETYMHKVAYTDNGRRLHMIRNNQK